MSYQIIDYASQYRGSAARIDPRAPLARHMGWQPPTNNATPSEYASPEPNAYNYAVRAKKPIVCELTNHAVFFRDVESGKWWSLYIISKENISAMFAWARSQTIDIFWFNSKIPRKRTRRGILFNYKPADINSNERLFQMGYYSKLQSKYFSEDDKKLLELLGPIRDRVLEGLSESSEASFSQQDHI